MAIRNLVMATLLTGLVSTMMTACEKEGPMEKAGKAFDDAASDMADKANEAAEAIERKVEE